MEYGTDHIYQEENIDIKKFLFKMLSNWYWFALSLFLTITSAYLINRYSEPVYSVNSTIIVRDYEKGSGLIGAEQMIESLDMFSSRKNIQNEIGILKSYSLAQKVMKELDNFKITYVNVGRRGIAESKLYTQSPIIVKPDTSANQRYGYPVYITIISDTEYELKIDEEFNIKKRMKFGESFINEDFNFIIELRDKKNFFVENLSSGKYYFIINSLNSLTNSYRSKLGVGVTDKESSILTLSTQGYVAQQEVDYLNKLMEVFINSDLEEKNLTAVNTIKFIDDLLMEVDDSLASAESNLMQFRQSHKILDISREGSAIFEQIEALQQEKTQLSIKIKYYNYLLDYIESKSDFKDIIAPSIIGINDPVLMSLLTQLSDLYSEKTELLYTAKENNPLIDVAIRKLTSTREGLLENLGNLIYSTDIAMDDVERRINKVDIEIRKLPATERKLIRIERNFNLNNDIYTYLLEKRAEAGIAQASNIPNNKILDIARVNNATKVSPKNSMNYMIALVIGLAIPLVIILLFDYFNNKIIDKSDIENNTNVPILGTIGHNHDESDLPVHQNPKSSIAESFRSIRTSIQYLLPEKERNIISISSAIVSEGKTFVAANLSIIIAMSGKKTLLVGLDMRKPKIHKDFNVNNDVGLSTYLIRETSYEDVIRSTDIENLYIATSGPIPPNPAELIEKESMKEFFDKVRKEFDYVVLDTPPVAIVTDAILLTQYTDTNIFVIRQKYSSKSVIQYIDELFNKKDIKNLSLLVNDVKIPSYYGYGYGYYFGYDYGYGYGYGYGRGYYGDEDKTPKNISAKIRRVLFGKRTG